MVKVAGASRHSLRQGFPYISRSGPVFIFIITTQAGSSINIHNKGPILIFIHTLQIFYLYYATFIQSHQISIRNALPPKQTLAHIILHIKGTIYRGHVTNPIHSPTTNTK